MALPFPMNMMNMYFSVWYALKRFICYQNLKKLIIFDEAFSLQWVIFLQKRCVPNESPFLDILLDSIGWGRFCWKIVMRQRRVLLYEYFTLKICLQGCIQCQEFDFIIGPKDRVHPVDNPIISGSVARNVIESYLISNQEVRWLQSELTTWWG